MADKEFKSVAGFIQFDPEEREVNGQPIRDVTIRALGSEGPYIKITVWEEFGDIELYRGQFLAVDGPFEARVVPNKQGVSTTYLNMSAKSIVVLEPVARGEASVVTKKKGTKERAF